jgi:hypothetical protein
MRRSFLFTSAALFTLAAGCSSGKGGGTPDLVCPGPVGTAFDKDADLLTDVQEAALGTNPAKADTDADGFSDYVEVSAGTDPLSAASKPSATQVVSTHKIVDAGDLIGGPGAQGAIGDWLLSNDKIHAIVQREDADQMQLGTFGGNLIDADVIRAPGDPGNDRVGMVIPFVSLGSTIHPNKIEVINDGTDGGAVDIRVCGVNDTYQYLDLTATFAEFLGAGSLGYDANETHPVTMSNDFILAPGSNVVEMVTTLANEGPTYVFPIGDVIDSGAAEEIFATNNQGYGSTGFQALTQTQPPTAYMGFLGQGAGWGYVTDGDPNTSVTISGVSVFIQGFSSAFAVIGSDPSAGPGPGLNQIKKGQRFSFHRGIVITDGTGAVDPIAARYYDRHAAAGARASVHTGTVLDNGGNPVAGVRITALASSTDPTFFGNPVTSTESDAAGDFALTLPDGTYDIGADLRGYGLPTYSSGTDVSKKTFFSQNTITLKEITLTNGSALPDVTLPVPGTLHITVTDPAAAPLPSRLAVVERSGTNVLPNDSIFRDPKEDDSNVIVASRLSKNGVFDVTLPAGSYDVYATHGIEYSLGVSTNQAVTASNVTNVPLTVGRAVDSTGWISGDFHVHMLNSPDSPVSLSDRTLNAATDGLDILVTTDHDFVTDLSPEVAALALGSAMNAVPGEEVTTWDMGHFNLFPLVVDPNSLTGGAYKWAGNASDGAISHKTAAQIFTDIDGANPGTQVREVNHPRGFRLQDYYSAIHLDTFTLQTKVAASFVRVPDQAGSSASDSKLFADFDAQEVMNGADYVNPNGSMGTSMAANLNDYLTLLDHGMTLAAVGNSDTHKIFANQLGYPRNFVKVADDNPAHIFQGANLENMAQGVVKGQIFFTTGPFLTVQVVGSSTGGPGDLVTPAAASVTVNVTADMPEWVAVDTAKLYVNTPNTAIAATGASSDPDGLTTAPAAQFSQPLVLTTLTNANGVKHVVGTATFTVPAPANGDEWIVASVSADNTTGKSLWPVVPNGTNAGNGIRPYALASAVYVDGNANGTWDPPGVITTAAYKVPAVPPLKQYSAKKHEIPAQPTDDIREQFERLTSQSCDVRHEGHPTRK